MKILMVSRSDIDGGAARAAYRLHKSLLSQNVDSQMLVQSKSSDDYTVLNEKSKLRKTYNKLRPILESIPVRFYKERTKTLFSPSCLPFSNNVDKINAMNPDIVHLHWICGGMLKIEDIACIKAPIVWSLHDMWAFTGGCHYAEECKGYEKECGSCKVLGSVREYDLSKRTWNRKNKTFIKIENLTIVGLSKWLSNCAQSSILLKNKKHVQFPNPIDTGVYKPFDKAKARELWGFPQDKKLVLFGAIGATSDPRKGFSELCEAISKLNNNNIEFVIFGSSEPQEPQIYGFKTHYLGSLHDDVSLVSLYSAVDVMVVPSLQEAFGQTASEAMSCGTPTVAFGHTGLLDIIDHKINGYLAQPYDVNDLAKGIDWILQSCDYNEYSKNARIKCVEQFDSVIVANRYINLYKRILKRV